MSANYSSRQVKAVIRPERTTVGSESEVAITMPSKNSWFHTGSVRMDKTSLM